MTQYFNDLFTSATTVDVTAHTSDSGNTWLLAKGTPAPKVFTNGALANGGSSTSAVIARPNVVSPQADNKVSGVFHYDSSSFSAIGLTVRTASDGNAGYLAAYNKASNTWAFFRLTSAASAAAGTALAATAAIPYTQNTNVNVEFSAEGAGTTVNLTLKLNGSTVLSYADTDAARVTTAGYPGVYFQVGNAAGSGAWFDSMSADTIEAVADTTLPTMTGTMASTGVTPSGYTLDWSGTTRGDNVAITGFETSANGTTWSDAGNVTSKAFSGLVASTSYPNYVRAYDAAGNKSTPALQLAVVTSAPSSDTTLPVLAGSITVGTVTSSTGQITWPAGSDNVAVTGYEVSNDGGATYANVGNVLTYTFTGLTASTAHGVRVRAVDAAGNKSTPALAVTLTTTAAVVTQPYPSTRNLNFADRVRDTTATEGTGTVTLSNASARTLASAYAVGTKRIPYCIENEAGSVWEVGQGTLVTATTFSRDEVTASSNAGALVAFGAGTKTLSVVAHAKAFNTFAVKDFIDLRDFDVDPTFVADSTAGIQAAIWAAWNKRISKIKCPDGRFKIGGPKGVSNAQLFIPNTRSTDPSRTILFEGAAPPCLEMQGLVSMPVTTNGTIFESTIQGGSGWSMLRGEAGDINDVMRWNYTNIGFRNMGFRTKVSGGANTMTALNLREFSQIVEFDNIRIDVDMPIISSPDPSAVNSSGLIMPPVDNHAQFNMGSMLIAGYTNGIVIGEHTHAKSIVILGCVNGVVVPIGNHGSMISHLLVECSKNSIQYQGNHPLAITCYSTEHNNDGNWFDFASDINCTAGSQPHRKIVITQATVIKSHAGNDDDGLVTAGFPVHKIFVGAGAN